MATFTNRATLSYGGRTVDSNTVTGTFLQTLSIIKTALSGTYAAGDTVTYVVTLSNAGATPLNGLTLTESAVLMMESGCKNVPVTVLESTVRPP